MRWKDFIVTASMALVGLPALVLLVVAVPTVLLISTSPECRGSLLPR